MAKAKKKITLFLSGKLRNCPDLMFKRYARWLIYHRSKAIEHLPDKEDSIDKIFKNCLIILFMMKQSLKSREKIFYILESQPKNNWTTFLDKLNTSDGLVMKAIYLLKILVQELILKEKEFKPFWTHAFKEISEKLLLHTETDFVDSHLISSKLLSKRQGENLQFSTTKKECQRIKNLQTTLWQSSTFLTADKWEEEVIPEKLKTMKIQIYPTEKQKTILNQIYSVHRYVYNKTLSRVKIHGDRVNFQSLRNKLVTCDTKLNSLEAKTGRQYIKQISDRIKLDPKNETLKAEKKNRQQQVRTSLKDVPSQRNSEIRDFELKVSKEIRANAVKSVCHAYEAGFTNLKKGNIKSFNMKFKKKNESRKCVELAKSEVKIENGKIIICKGSIEVHEDPNIKNYEFCMSSKNAKKTKDLVISHNCDLVLENGKYILYILLDTIQEQRCDTKTPKIIAGGDLGVRHFLTTYNNKSEIYEYDHNREYLKRLNNKIKHMKNFRKKKIKRSCLVDATKKRKSHRTSYRKKQIRKIEKKKKDYINNLHWYVINHLVKTNDIICMGDIKSQGIMKKNKNRYLNQEFSDLSFFKFKQRLAYKASIANKKMVLVSELYTSQGCSFCGCINKHIKSSTILNCKECKNNLPRDINSSKNHLMKGLLS